MTDLWEGQYKFGDMVFGAGTQCIVSSLEKTGYQVSPGDYSIPMTDEIRFRKDYLQPGTILMTVSAMDNYMLDSVYEGGPILEFPSGAKLMEQFMKEWRADEVRNIWGYVKPLTYRRLGQTRRIYGRPRDIAAPPRRNAMGWYDMVCSYQCVDTVSYSEEVFGKAGILPTAAGVNPTIISRGDGGAPTWFDIFIVGPIFNPVVDIGPLKLQINYGLPAGEIIQVSSYPWERRAMTSNGTNIVPRLIGTSPYLSEMRFPEGANWNVGIHGTGTTTDTNLILTWREAYHSM